MRTSSTLGATESLSVGVQLNRQNVPSDPTISLTNWSSDALYSEGSYTGSITLLQLYGAAVFIREAFPTENPSMDCLTTS